ncbi:MAG: helicase HerA-like domain-containing protein, partial [Paracoccus sp. (in: a-proteobacteria)]
VTQAELAAHLAASPLGLKYDRSIDRDSAHEMLLRRTEQAQAESEAPAETPPEAPAETLQQARRYQPPAARTPRATSSRSDSIAETFTKSLARQLGTRTGQALVRGILGSLTKKSR